MSNLVLWREGEGKNGAPIRVDGDVDLDQGILVVMGKGSRPRTVPLGNRALKALDNYLYIRKKHPGAVLPQLRLGPKGGLTDSGVRQVVSAASRLLQGEYSLINSGTRSPTPGWREVAPRAIS